MDPVSLSVEVWEDEAIGTSNSTFKEIYASPCRLKGVHVVGISLDDTEPAPGVDGTYKPGYVLLFDQSHTDSFNDADIKMRMRYGESIAQTARPTCINYLEYVIPGTGIRFDSGLVAVGRRDDVDDLETTMRTGNITFFFSPA